MCDADPCKHATPDQQFEDLQPQACPLLGTLFPSFFAPHF
jgi:hypothetical protein